MSAIVLAARGLVFCAGFDVAWMASQDAEAVAPGLPGIEAVFDTIEACTKPVIAAVQGAAMGGGLLLTLVADACLASEHAKFGAPEVKLGFFPNLRLIPRLERIVGVRAAKQLVLTGDPVSASTALDWGLVERVLPSRDLHAEAQALAEQLAALPPFAVQSAKAAFGAITPAGLYDLGEAAIRRVLGAARAHCRYGSLPHGSQEIVRTRSSCARTSRSMHECSINQKHATFARLFASNALYGHTQPKE